MLQINSQKHRRRRGVILTNQGFQKLEAAKVEAESNENSDRHFTLEALSLRTGLDSDTLMKVFSCQVGVDKQSLSRCFRAFNLQLEPSDCFHPVTPEAINPKSKICLGKLDGTEQPTTHFPQNQIDWGEAPDVSVFYGRTEELARLEKWIVGDRVRLVTLLGMGGMGKTWLSVKLAEHLKNEFEFVIWRSLRNAPPIKDMLADLIGFFSDKEETNLSETVDSTISRLIHYFKLCRCLLILDNAQTILQDASINDDAGQYCEGYEGYGQLLRQVGETLHQSCLLLTSREKPKQIGRLEGETLPVRVLQLKGLQLTEVQQIFKAKGSFWGSATDCNKLIEIYAGNPLALNIVFTTINKLFNGRIYEFLNQNITLFGDIKNLLKQHFDRLSNTEKQIIQWLANSYHPVSFSELREKILPPLSPQKLIEALESLQERSLIEQKDTFFSLSLVVRECVISCPENHTYCISDRVTK